MARTVAYERGFAQRSDTATFAVVAGPSHASKQEATKMARVLSKLGSKKIAKRNVKVAVIQHQSASDIVKDLAQHNVDVVYLASGTEDIARHIPTSQGSKQRIVVCSRGSSLPKGCVVGVELSGGRPRLVLNLQNSKRADLRFQPELLRLARIVR